MNERLDYIIAIAEEKNITRAAQRLYISQPALTRYINKLEEEYNIQIFDRSSNPITLTEAGRFFLDEKVRIRVAEQNLRNKLDLMKHKKVSLRVGTGIERCSSWMPELLKNFCPNHSEIDIQIIGCGERKLPELLAQSRIDLAIGAFSTSGSGFIYQHLLQDRLCLLLPLKYGLFPNNFDPVESLQKPYILSPEQLNDLEYIAPAEGMGSYEMYMALANQYSIRIRKKISSNNPSSIRKMIVSGLGYGYVAVLRKEDLCDSSGVPTAGCAILPGLSEHRFCSVMYRENDVNGAVLQELSDECKRLFGDPSVQ